MYTKNRVSILLLAICLSGVSASLIAADAKKADTKMAEAQAMIAAAEQARKKAASVDSEWRDTGKFIKQAQDALKAGELDDAMRLAKVAEDQGNLGYEQGFSQRELKLPSYFKVKSSAPIAVSAAMAMKEHKITPALTSVEVMHNGEMVAISRSADKGAVIPKVYTTTDRECPPFCIQPISISPGVDTIGELEVLDYLQRIANGDPTVLVVDSRTPDWRVRGTIPGSVNIPWNRINLNIQGSFEGQDEAESLNDILHNQFHARKANGTWDFRNAKTLVLFCNGIWCPQSAANIRTLTKLGYPAYKLKWYRGGMQSWVSAGLTTVNK
jgi:rhodanese-related sulfurtransferase